MTKIKSLIGLAMLSLALMFVTGCGSTKALAAYKTEGVIITSVNAGIGIWGDRVRAGNATQKQVDAVREAYVDYFTAQVVAKAAMEKYVASPDTASTPDELELANSAVKDAETALLNLLNEYLNAK